MDKINPTFIALTAKAINYCLFAWKRCEWSVPPEFGPGGGAQHNCDTRNIDYVVNNARTDVVRHLDTDVLSSSPEVQAQKVHNICSMIHGSIHWTGMDPAIALPHNDQGSFEEEFIHYVLEELIEQPDDLFNCLSRFVADTEASMRLSAVRPMGGSATASSSQPDPCSNSNSNCNDITSITNMTRVENWGLVYGSTSVEGAMLVEG